MTEDGDIPHLPYKKERAIMAKYLGKRLLHGLISIIIVVGIVMSLIYSLMDRNLIFAKDSTYSHQKNNAKVTYSYQKWEEYGYLDYVTYEDYIMSHNLFLNSYLELIEEFFKKRYINNRTPGDRCLIYCSTIRMCTIVAD